MLESPIWFTQNACILEILQHDSYTGGIPGSVQRGSHKKGGSGNYPKWIAWKVDCWGISGIIYTKGMILANPTVFDTKVGCGESMLFVYGSFSRWSRNMIHMKFDSRESLTWFTQRFAFRQVPTWWYTRGWSWKASNAIRPKDKHSGGSSTWCARKGGMSEISTVDYRKMSRLGTFLEFANFM